MATVTYTGNSISVKKKVKVSPPEGGLDNAVIKIGLGDRLLSWTGFVAADIVADWNATEDIVLKEITAEVSGDDVIFTHSSSNADFVLTVLVDDEIGLSSAIHQLEFSVGGTGGTYKVTFDAQQTGNVTYVPGTMATSASNLTTGMNALSNVAPGDVIITSPSARHLSLDWSAGAYAGKDIPLITVDGTNLLGGNAGIVVETVQQGSAGANEIQQIAFDVDPTLVKTKDKQRLSISGELTSGTATLTVTNPNTAATSTTSAITILGATVATIVSALQATAALTNPEVSGSGGPLPVNPIDIEFGDDLDGINVAVMVSDSSLLVGSGLALTVETKTQGVPGTNAILQFTWSPTGLGDGTEFGNVVSSASNYKIGFAFRSQTLNTEAPAQGYADLLGCTYTPRIVLGTATTATIKALLAGTTTYERLTGANLLAAKQHMGPPGMEYNADDFTVTSGNALSSTTNSLNLEFINRQHSQPYEMYKGMVLVLEKISDGSLQCIRWIGTFEGGIETQQPVAGTNEVQQLVSYGYLLTTGTFNFDLDGVNSATIDLAAGNITASIVQDVLRAAYQKTLVDATDHVSLMLYQSSGSAGSFPYYVVVPNPVTSADLLAAGFTDPVSPGAPGLPTAPGSWRCAWHAYDQTLYTDDISSGATLAEFVTNCNSAILKARRNFTLPFSVDGGPVIPGATMGGKQTGLQPSATANISFTEFDTTATSMIIDGDPQRLICMRFIPSVPVAGYVFQNCILHLKASGTINAGNAIEIWIENNANPTMVTSISDESTRHFSQGATMNWSPGVGTAGTSYSVDITSLIQAAFNKVGYVQGNPINIHMWPGPFGESFDVSEMDFYSLNHATSSNRPSIDFKWLDPNSPSKPIRITGTRDGQQSLNITQMTIESSSNHPSLVVTSIHDGETHTVFNTVGDSYCLKIQIEGAAAGDYWLITGIPYDVTAAELAVLVNAVLGAGSITAWSGGPHPDTPISLTFGGAFANTNMAPIIVFPMFSPVIVRNERLPTRTDNVFELTVIPDEGTLGMNYSSDPTKNTFFLDFLTNESTEANTAVQIRFTGLTPERIEDAINEHFGHKVVSVTRIVRSQEWAPVRTVRGSYSSTTKKYYVWYYRGVYRLTFCNEFADPATIQSITLRLPTKVDGVTPIDPYDFMIFSDGAAPSDDLRTESSRIALNFQMAMTAGAPIHLFDLTRKTDPTPNQMTWAYSIRTQFTKDDTVNGLGRVSIADLPPDLKIQWEWCYFTWSGLGTEYEKKVFTHLAYSPPVNWDASPEQHRAAMQAMVRVTPDKYPTDFLGEGNLEVTGSFYNSWLPDPYGLQTTAVVTGEADRDFNNLKVTLINGLARQPLTESNYELRPLLIVPYSWMQTTDTVADYRFRKPILETQVYQKPIPPLVNERQRFDLQDSLEDGASIFIGYNNDVITLTGATTVAAAEEAINTQIMGCFQEGIRKSIYTTTDGDSVTYHDADVILPTKMAKSITMFGTTLGGDPFEVEFTGNGFQYSDVDNLVVMGGSANATVTTTQAGSVQQPEIQRLTMTTGVNSGTFTINIGGQVTGSESYAASNATLDTDIEALSTIGAGKVALTGGPLHTAPVTLTFSQTLNNVATIVIVASLNNATVVATAIQSGGTNGSVTIDEMVEGAGSAFYSSPANYDTGNVPSSQDTLVIEDATTPIKYGIDQTTEFVVADTAGLLLHVSRRKVFQNGQKIWIESTSALPTGLSAQYYFVVNAGSDGTFSLATTLGGSPVIATGDGVGTHSGFIKDLTVLVYAKYTGDQIGLPRRRANGAEEYLPCYFRAKFAAASIGLEEAGDSVSLLRMDCMDHPTVIVVDSSQSSAVNNVPACLFLTNNTGASLDMTNSEVGLSVYSNEHSTIGDVTVRSGSLLANNCTLSGDTKKTPDGDITLTGSTTSNGGIINI